jgi:GT2 family glycosyltransferase
MISVVIPTCHRNDLLARCLDRLAPGVQTFAPDQYEVVVTDDGSRSTSEKLIHDNYTWARWVQGPRHGPAANRNFGARSTGNPWIAFTDDDCIPESGWLEGFASAVTDRFAVYEGKTTCNGGIESPLYDAPVNLTGGGLWSCNMMVRRDVFEQMGGFDESFPHPHMEDTDFRERLLAAGIPFQFVPNAAVDHPPRPLQPGLRRAGTHECDVIYWRKWNMPVRPVAHCVGIIKDRIRKLLRHRFSMDSLVATKWMVEEVLATAWSYPRWLAAHPPTAADARRPLNGARRS